MPVPAKAASSLPSPSNLAVLQPLGNYRRCKFASPLVFHPRRPKVHLGCRTARLPELDSHTPATQALDQYQCYKLMMLCEYFGFSLSYRR